MTSATAVSKKSMPQREGAAGSTNLKSFFSPRLVRHIGADLARVQPGFPEQAFVKDATSGLQKLELLERAKHIAAALAKHLPRAYPEAIAVLLRSLGPELPGDELLGVGMAPFIYLPHVLFVAEHGLDHFELSMRAQHELTRRFSAEFSIRSFIAKDPERTLATLREWAKDPSPHVRRLVSEGTRLRLPWARRVAWLDENPERVVELLELLEDDASTMVRRSVANNLNDLGKVYPALLTRTCAAWLDKGSAARRALVEHALRSAVKRGDAGALSLLGFGRRPAVCVEHARLQPPRIVLGQSVAVSFELKSTSHEPQSLLVDLVVHFVKANGQARPKVFKLKRLTLAPGAAVRLERKISFAALTTRQHFPGAHAFDVHVNGVRYHVAELDVRR